MNINLKLRISILLLVVVAASITSQQLKAQVTVGSNEPPARAAVLEIKTDKDPNDPTEVTDDENITSKKGGLGLPRVKLVDKTTLDPFILSTGADWTTAATKKELSIKHAGLMVYNINISDGDEGGGTINLNKKLKLGVYVWDGAKWSLVGEGVGQRYFYVPSFNIKLDAIRLNPSPGDPADPSLTGPTAPFKCDLYEEYRKQFVRAGNSTFVSNRSAADLPMVPSPEASKIYERDELDYVITYYDQSILDGVMVTNDGELYYYVQSLQTTPNSFLNVVFIVKE